MRLVNSRTWVPTSRNTRGRQTGSSYKRLASDFVSLVALYRSKWTAIGGMCGVTDEQLERGGVLGPAAFAAVSRRENKMPPSLTEGAQKVRRFWSLADRSYDQCQRVIAFYEWGRADLGSIAPSLRRNVGARAKLSGRMRRSLRRRRPRRRLRSVLTWARAAARLKLWRR